MKAFLIVSIVMVSVAFPAAAQATKRQCHIITTVEQCQAKPGCFWWNGICYKKGEHPVH